MAETYATYKIWSGSAPYNIEFNGRLCGQRVNAFTFDRDALLAVCAEIDDADVDRCVDWAHRIRMAIGEEE